MSVVDLILRDKLEEAEQALKAGAVSPVFEQLIAQAQGHSQPLSMLVADPPPYTTVNPSYTCNIGCKMCVTGFHEQTDIYEGYRFLLPDQFEAMRPWVEAGTHVVFVGLGETLDSPYLLDYIKSIKDKIVAVTTSGVPLTREKITGLLEAGVDILNISFDGKTSLGHGGGTDAYVKNIWKRIDLVLEIKEEMSLERPQLGLDIVVNRENLDDLDNILEQAQQRGIRNVYLMPMMVNHDKVQVNPELFEESFGINFNECRDRVNQVIDRWNSEDMQVFAHIYDRMEDKYPTCAYIDNFVSLNGALDRPTMCCGTLTLPIREDGMLPHDYWNTFPFRYLRYVHLNGTYEQLPKECQGCKVMNPKQYFEECGKGLVREPESFNPYPVYQNASKLKSEKDFDKASEGFLEILDAKVSDELKGKAAYHLAEMEVVQGDHNQALMWAEKSLRYDFGHMMAWGLVYLLMRVLEIKSEGIAGKKYPIVFHKKVSEKIDIPRLQKTL